MGTRLRVVEVLVGFPSEVLHPVSIDATAPIMLLILHGTEHCLVSIHVELIRVPIPPKLFEVFMLFPRVRVLRVLRPFERSVRRRSRHSSPAVSH